LLTKSYHSEATATGGGIPAADNVWQRPCGPLACSGHHTLTLPVLRAASVKPDWRSPCAKLQLRQGRARAVWSAYAVPGRSPLNCYRLFPSRILRDVCIGTRVPRRASANVARGSQTEAFM